MQTDTARAVSVQTNIHRNPKKNSMCQDTHMQVHYGVNQKSNVALCAKCTKHKAAATHIPRHCHCCVAVITEDMLENCSIAWKVQKTKKNAPPADKETVITITEKTKEDAVKRKLKFAGTQKMRLTLYPDNFMSPVYGDDEKESTNTSTAEGSKQKKVNSLKRKETHAVAFTPFPPKAPKKTRKEDQ